MQEDQTRLPSSGRKLPMLSSLDLQLPLWQPGGGHHPSNWSDAYLGEARSGNHRVSTPTTVGHFSSSGEWGWRVVGSTEP